MPTGDVARGVDGLDLAAAGDAVVDGVPSAQRLNENLLLRDGDVTGVPSTLTTAKHVGS